MALSQPVPGMMKIAYALRASRYRCTAFVGSGGKSSALFQVAWEMPPPVFLAVTTHLAVSQTELADRWVVVQSVRDIPEPEAIAGSRVLFTGPQDEVGKVRGVGNDVLEHIFRLAEQFSCPLLIEADGARQLPLKAPAEHEPVLPHFCDLVVVVAGLSALGKPLDDESVHRVDRYMELSGLERGQAITTQAIARVLLHPNGGMKGIPPGARRVVLLNQADTVELQAQAIDLSGMLLEKFDAVLIASLQAGVSTAVVPGIESLSGEVYAVHQRIGGVILAAGGARRYGEPKILLPWKGEAIIRHVAKTALAAGLNTVVVVVGDQIADIHEAVADLDVKLVHNSAWESGQSSSVKAGLQELPTNVGGAVFLLGDQPKIPPALVRALVEKHAASLSPIVAPLVDGQRGNPVLFDQETFPEFMAISGDVGGRALFARFPVEWVPWHDADVLLDIDSPQDYLRLQDEK